MNMIDITILGIVEGITEFLPVSSTGHLILTAKLLGHSQTEFMKSFEIFIQLGAILAVVVFYQKSLLRKKEIWTRIIAAFVPTAIIGFALYKIVKNFLFESPLLIAWSLFWGGLVIIIFDLFHKDANSKIEEIEQIPYRTAVLIGLFQTFALIPGVSRSAASIIGGLMMGIKRKAVVEFSFLLAVPTILAATAYDLLKQAGELNPAEFGYFGLGFVVSFIVAFISIKFILRFIQRFNFVPFGIYRVLLAVVLLSTGFVNNPQTEPDKVTKKGEFFGGYVKVDVCVHENETEKIEMALEEVWERFTDIQGRLNADDPQSDLSKINASYPKDVTIGADTYQLITDALTYHKISRGSFDISIGPLMRLWNDKMQENTLPSDKEIDAAKKQMGAESVELLPGNKIRLKKSGMMLSLASILDGYAADEAVRILKEHGITDFLVDASGELYAAGRNCRGKPWHIGVRHPQDPAKIIDVVEAADFSVATLGNYVPSGQPRTLIIDPVTGRPSEHVLSATVISPTAEFSDFLSNALCALDPQEGLKVTESLGQGYASMVIVRKADGQMKEMKSLQYAQYQAGRP